MDRPPPAAPRVVVAQVRATMADAPFMTASAEPGLKPYLPGGRAHTVRERAAHCGAAG